MPESGVNHRPWEGWRGLRACTAPLRLIGACPRSLGSRCLLSGPVCAPPCRAVCNGPPGPQGRGHVPSSLLGLTHWTFLLQLISLPMELVPFRKSLPGSILNDLLSKIPYLTKTSCVLCLQYGLN